MRQDQHKITLSIDGTDYGVWDNFTGGATEGDESKYREGGMGSPVSLGGPPSTENVTLARLYRVDRDAAIEKPLHALVGRGWCVVVKQPLNRDGTIPAGVKPTTYKGVLQRVTPPEAESNGSDPAMIEVEVSTSGAPA